MKKIKLFILFIVLNFTSYSQNDSITLPKLWIKTNPFQYLDWYNGSNYHLGLEYKLNSTICMNTEFGKVFDFPGWNQTFYQNGFFVRHEVKNYLQQDNGDNVYLSIEGVLSKQSMIRTDRFEFSRDSLYEKTYSTERKFFGVSGLIGWMKQYKSGFIFEAMAGFGLRYNMVTNELSDEESAARLLGDWTVPTNYLIKKGNHIIPRFHMGIKVGWRLFK